MVSGVPTWVVKGRWDAGERIIDIESDFGLNQEEIKQALTFEGIHIEQDAA